MASKKIIFFKADSVADLVKGGFVKRPKKTVAQLKAEAQNSPMIPEGERYQFVVQVHQVPTGRYCYLMGSGNLVRCTYLFNEEGGGYKCSLTLKHPNYYIRWEKGKGAKKLRECYWFPSIDDSELMEKLKKQKWRLTKTLDFLRHWGIRKGIKKMQEEDALI